MAVPSLVPILLFVLSFVTFSQQQISTNPDDVAFYLYQNEANLADFDLLVYNNVNSIVNSRYDRSKRLFVLVHGFLQNYTGIFPQLVKDAYLQYGFGDENNIIAVDYGKLATPNPDAPLPSNLGALPLGTGLSLLLYPLAVDNVPIVATRIVQFLSFLSNEGFLLQGFEQVHLIGMSLGSHVVGRVGAQLQATNAGVVGRITGLDPAGPLYQGAPTSERLDASDGAFVDVIHTNQGEAGYLGSIGHADFLVNGGGPTQPGCPLAPGSVAEAICSHAKAIEYYVLSIANSGLKGCKCQPGGLLCGNDCTTFGAYTTPSAIGDYYLKLDTSKSQ